MVGHGWLSRGSFKTRTCIRRPVQEVLICLLKSPKRAKTLTAESNRNLLLIGLQLYLNCVR